MLNGADVVRVEAKFSRISLIPWIHKRSGNIRMREAQGVAELMACHSKQIRTYSRKSHQLNLLQNYSIIVS